MRALASVALFLAAGSVLADETGYACFARDIDDIATPGQDVVRFATFNAFLNRNNAGELIEDLGGAVDPQIAAVAEIIQRVRPDVLLLNEFDYDDGHEALQLFLQNYLSVPQNGQDPIDFEHVYSAESNTGIASGLDFDNDGSTSGPGDAYGFGFFPGQYGMVLLSQHSIDEHRVRSFQTFLWKDMPGALLPDNPNTTQPKDWYSPAELRVFRLSSKSHWDIPVQIGSRTVHVLAAHPTPPIFDDPIDYPVGSIDYNGRRNHDEIRFWADYIDGYRDSRYIYDDRGRRGGLLSGPFVILGDYNADPNDGDSTNDAIDQLLGHPKIDSRIAPASLGGIADSADAGGLNDFHTANPALDTGDFNPANPGNLRVDYVLPSAEGLNPLCGGVFWPSEGDASYPLVGPGFPVVSSDHHLVWLDIEVEGANLWYRRDKNRSRGRDW